MESGTSGARRGAGRQSLCAKFGSRLCARQGPARCAAQDPGGRQYRLGGAAPGVHDFDLVTLYDALKPGGELVMGDYSSKPGAGTSVVQTLHRSEEALVTSEIEAAGFTLIDHGDFLRVPGDARDTHSHSSAQPVDIYVLKFRKPG